MISIFCRVTKFGLLLTALVLVAALMLAFMVRWTLYDTLAFLLLLSLLLPSLLIMFIPSTFKRPVSSWKALNLRKTLLMASSVRLKPLNCSRLPCVYAQETLTIQRDRKSGSAGMPRPRSTLFPYTTLFRSAEFTENIINGVERPVKAAELFAFTLRVRAGNTDNSARSEERFSRNAETEIYTLSLHDALPIC